MMEVNTFTFIEHYQKLRASMILSWVLLGTGPIPSNFICPLDRCVMEIFGLQSRQVFMYAHWRGKEDNEIPHYMTTAGDR